MVTDATSVLPHDATNPHHMRLIRIDEKPFRASDVKGGSSDVSGLVPSATLFDEIELELVEQYVARLQSYTDEIEMLGSAALYMVAEEVGEKGGDPQFVAKLCRIGLLPSPLCIEHRRVKACARHLALYMRRKCLATIPIDKRRAEVCEGLEMCTGLLR